MTERTKDRIALVLTVVIVGAIAWPTVLGLYYGLKLFIDGGVE